MISRGFVDLLFILLCSTIVLLAQSIPLRGLMAEPAEAGSGGTRPLDTDSVILVSVAESSVSTVDGTGSHLSDLALPSESSTVIIVPATKKITHHRIIDIWREAREAGLSVELGVQNGGGN